MSYRPQFAYEQAPEGWQDEEFEYWFDFSHLPVFQIGLLPGQEILDIVLPLERDAEFRWRAIQVSNPGSVLGLRFHAPDGSELADGFALMEDFSGFPGAVGGVPGGTPVPIEPEVVCPIGAVLLLDVRNMAP